MYWRKRIKSFKLNLWVFLFMKKKPRKKQMLNVSEMNRILFDRSDGKIGDTVVSTFVYREIKKKYPSLIIDVLTKGNNKDVLIHNTNIDNLYDANDLDCFFLQQNKYDLFIYFSEVVRIKNLRIIKRIKSQNYLGIGKKKYNIFNYLLCDEIKNMHISKKYEVLLKNIGIKVSSNRYDLCFSENENIIAKRCIKKIKSRKKIVFLNLFGGSKKRTIKENKAKELISQISRLNLDVVLPFSYANRLLIKRISESFENCYYFAKIKNINQYAALVKHVDCVISPDTSFIHIAEGLDKKLIGIYNPDSEITWETKNQMSYILYSKNKVKSDINSFSIEELVTILKEII